MDSLNALPHKDNRTNYWFVGIVLLLVRNAMVIMVVLFSIVVIVVAKTASLMVRDQQDLDNIDSTMIRAGCTVAQITHVIVIVSLIDNSSSRTASRIMPTSVITETKMLLAVPTAAGEIDNMNNELTELILNL